MSSANNKRAKFNSDNGDVGGMQLALQYMRDFRQNVAAYHTGRADALVLLNRSAALLSTAVQTQYFGSSGLETVRCYIDLYGIINALACQPTSEALWSCLTVLQRAAENLQARHALIAEYRFVPVLALVLKHHQKQAQEKQLQCVLSLLQNFSLDLCIKWEEPFVDCLLEQLLQVLGSGEMALGSLALSTLNNLCHKNFMVVLLLLRKVEAKQFCQQIEPYGALAIRMMLLLLDDVQAPSDQELLKFIRYNFEQLQKSLRDWHLPQLQHTLDVLLDGKMHERLRQMMLQYDGYVAHVEQLLDILQEDHDKHDSNKASDKQQEMCIALIFQLVQHLLQSGALPEWEVSLESLLPRIFQLICKWLASEHCGAQAIMLLQCLIQLGKKDTALTLLIRETKTLGQLVALAENPSTSAAQTNAILVLLLTLLQQKKTQKSVLAKISDSFFDIILAPLMTAPGNMGDVQKAVPCLLLLSNFAKIAQKAYFDKCCQVLRMPSIQTALARALRSNQNQLCAQVLQIAQFEHFPHEQVALQVTAISRLIANCSEQQQNPTENMLATQQWFACNKFFKTQRALLSKSANERLEVLLADVSKALTNNKLESVPVSEIIELSNFKISELTNAEQQSLRKLQEAGSEITQLSQRIKLLTAESDKRNELHLELQINHERLATQCKDLQCQRDNLKKSYSDLLKKHTEQSKIFEVNEKRLQVKVAELVQLQNELQQLQQQLKSKSQEWEKLQCSYKETCVRIEALKQTVAAYEREIENKKQIIASQDADIKKTLKVLEEEKDKHQKSVDLVNVLEASIKEKNAQIENYEQELSETEEMRKTIMSLMESKRPKKK